VRRPEASVARAAAAGAGGADSTGKRHARGSPTPVWAPVARGDSGWGWGPPRYLTPAQVQEAAAVLAGLTGEDLIAGVDPAELGRRDVYPGTWDRPGELEWVAEFLPDVTGFFVAAAAAGDAVICAIV
jgi:hypothetical protein